MSGNAEVNIILRSCQYDFVEIILKIIDARKTWSAISIAYVSVTAAKSYNLTVEVSVTETSD